VSTPEEIGEPRLQPETPMRIKQNKSGQIKRLNISKTIMMSGLKVEGYHSVQSGTGANCSSELGCMMQVIFERLLSFEKKSAFFL
jgi:hypothetical protein